ncbi:nuclear transport factor 2 family protein [Georgenia sp. EYE_87]|uniref:nuclear transport factor 2 family protein n=1 Tax=Georgenia sp. EYE_87 TaxID=2853448 RepID=UPI002002A851|nr:nuclear transport factor 2 family protein [Georgenia sp. EYE_87]MCK6212119.1 nuclear transport factor 2 family protein [Georgenia sp. EYE_87]
MSTEKIEANKELVRRFYREVPYGPGGNLDVIDELLAEDYKQHNPEAGQGREGVKHFFTNVIPVPLTGDLAGEQDVTLIAEGDMVVRQEVRHNGMLIDIFRIEDGKLAEHWDAWRPAAGYERPPSF